MEGDGGGDMIVIRYADETIAGFQHEHKARAFLDDLKEDTDGFRSADPDLAFIALSIG